MAIWKDQNGTLHDDMEGTALSLPSWPQGLVLLTSEQAAALQQPSANQLILNQITALEASVTDRRIREAVLGVDNGWLKNLNNQIATLRSSLQK